MATQNPLSSISYNSEEFLKEKLELWLSHHIIQCYMYIKHKGEEGDKDHIHFRFEPNRRIDPMSLQEELREYVPYNPKPLGCRPFRFSKEEDWYLYVVHDPEYLRLKYGGGEKGEKLPYSLDDIVVSDYYDKEIAFIRAKISLNHTCSSMASRLQSGESPVKLVLEGENPFQVNAIQKTLYTYDFQRVVEENNLLQKQLNGIIIALKKDGIEPVFDSDYTCTLSKL